MQATTDIPPVIITGQCESLTPVAAAERIATVDVLRGVALFGILTVNMMAFSWPADLLLPGPRLGESRLDVLADWLIRLLAEGKFYPQFAFLFGLGAAIQMARAEVRGANFTGHFCRRMLALLGFGLAHALLIWEGDILVWYSLCGFLLLAFRKRKPKTLLIWAAACLLIPVLLITLLWLLLAGLSLVPEAGRAIQQQLATVPTETAQKLEKLIRVFALGSYGEIFVERLGRLVFIWLVGLLYVPAFFAMFLLGLYAGQRRIFHGVAANLGFIRRVLIWGLAIGLPANLFYAVAMATSGLSDPHFLWLIGHAFLVLGGPAQGLAYAAALTLLLRRDRAQCLARPLAAVGRMALSQYLLQSLICTTIFYSYGLGLFGLSGRATGLGLAVAIYSAQLLFSRWWLDRFRFGPLEWLWRTLTYGRRPPLRI